MAVPNAVEAKLDRLLDKLDRLTPDQTPPAVPAPVAAPPADEEALYQRLKTRLMREAPALIKLLASRPELQVSVERPVLEIDGKTLKGRLAQLIADGWFAGPKTGNAAFEELKRRGASTAKPNVYRELDKLAELGFVTKEATGYQAVLDAKITVSK